MEDSKRKPFLIINPIFDSELSENNKDKLPENFNRESVISQAKKNLNISEKISIGFID